MAPAPMNSLSDPAPLLVLFDGACAVCSGAVQWILHRDRAGLFHFAPLQAPWVAGFLKSRGLASDMKTMVLVTADGVYLRSEAVRQVALRLRGWPRVAGQLARVVPLGLRDRLYDLFARNRLTLSRLIGAERCHLPTEAQRARIHGDSQPPSWLAMRSGLACSEQTHLESSVPCR